MEKNTRMRGPADPKRSGTTAPRVRRYGPENTAFQKSGAWHPQLLTLVVVC
jgi:hypothetical protein